MKKINSSNFKKAMSNFATGVTIISINYKNTFIGKTVNSFSSLSLNPPLILFSLDKKSTSINKFKISKNIGISFLSNKQKELSIYFSKKNSLWGNTKFFLTKNKIPLIERSVINLNCVSIKKVPSGDHIIFICKVNEIFSSKKLKPLIYVNNKYT